MMTLYLRLVLISCLWVPMAVTAVADDRHLLIVGGLGGEDYYSDLFQRRAATLVEVAREHLEIPSRRIIWLAETPQADHQGKALPSHRDGVLAALDRIAQESQPGHRVLLVLIGHGTAGTRALFNLPGPDLSAGDLAQALEPLTDRRIAVVNAAPASAAFINALSAPQRVVITATASVAENHHTLFADPFVAALAQEAADADKDGRVSLLEAFVYTNREVEKRFESDRRIRTEHALLDDNGDGQGSREPDPSVGDGAVARHWHFSAPGGAENASERLQLRLQARQLVDRIEALKRLKPRLETAEYQNRLETLLVELALNRRAWRSGEVP